MIGKPDPDRYTSSPHIVIKSFFRQVKNFLKWFKHRVTHKIEYLKPNNLFDILSIHGLSLVAIIILWEIVEDILFPMWFVHLGSNVHPIFLVGVPISWLACFHWFVVPIAFSAWLKFKKMIRGNG